MSALSELFADQHDSVVLAARLVQLNLELPWSPGVKCKCFVALGRINRANASLR